MVWLIATVLFLRLATALSSTPTARLARIRIIYRVETTEFTISELVRREGAQTHPLYPFARAIWTDSSSSERWPDTDVGSALLETSYFVPVTYEPFTTCSGRKWEYVTTVPISTTAAPGTGVRPFVSHKTTGLVGTKVVTSVYVVLNPVDVDASVYSAASESNEPPGVSVCSEPGRTTATTAEITNSESIAKTKTNEATGTIEVSSPEGIKCGSSNPSCSECTYWIEYCYGACPPITDEYYECKDGKRYHKGGASILSASDTHRLGLLVLASWIGVWCFV